MLSFSDHFGIEKLRIDGSRDNFGDTFGFRKMERNILTFRLMLPILAERLTGTGIVVYCRISQNCIELGKCLFVWNRQNFFFIIEFIKERALALLGLVILRSFGKCFGLLREYPELSLRSPNCDQHQISPHHISAFSNIYRAQELREWSPKMNSFYISNEFSPLVLNKMFRTSKENLHTCC